jgi:biotin synthase
MLAFMAGANSIFYGDKLLTTGNPDVEDDMKMLREAGMRALVPATEETPATHTELPARAPAPAE